MEDMFTPRECVFDPLMDFAEVDQFGYINLRQAFLTGVVDGQLAPEEGAYSGIDDPEAIMSAPKDEFEAIRQAQYAASYKPKSKSQSAAPAAPSTEGEGASSAAAE